MRVRDCFRAFRSLRALASVFIKKAKTFNHEHMLPQLDSCASWDDIILAESLSSTTISIFSFSFGPPRLRHIVPLRRQLEYYRHINFENADDCIVCSESVGCL